MRGCMKHMLKNKWGRVVSMGPPLPKHFTEYAGKTAYYMSKCGMSMVALGAAAESRRMQYYDQHCAGDDYREFSGDEL